MQTVQFSLVVIVSLFSHVLTEEVCSYYPYTYCEDGYYCCEYDTKCCPVLAIGAIIGIAIGGILFISCVVVVICVVTKKNHRPGQIIHPSQQTGVAIVSSGQQHGPPMYGQPMYGQPSYGQPSYGQPQYGLQQPQGVEKAGSSDPAYPPPPAAY